MKNTMLLVQTTVVSCIVIALLSVMGFAKQTPSPEYTPKEYIVVAGMTYPTLEKKVNEKLAEGWHLEGGVNGFAQALSK